jgi:hypothetical protein
MKINPRIMLHYSIILVLLTITLISCTSNTANPNPLSVAISSPTGTVYTKGNVSLQLVVSGTPDTVEILKNDTVLVSNLSAPYSYTWNTSSETEGSYTIKAKVKRGTEIVESDKPLNIIVDRTPPTILSRTPAPGANDILYAAPIQVGFSEAMLASSTSSANLQLSASVPPSTNSTPVSITTSLSDDGKTLTLQGEKNGLTTFDSEARLSLSKLTDLAGNELPQTTWTWNLPAWLTLGSKKLSDADTNRGVSVDPDALELDSKGNPVVVINELTGDNVNGKSLLYAQRWTGTSWERLDTIVEGSGFFFMAAALTLDATGQPIVARGLTLTPLEVVRWNGSGWQALGNSLNIDENKTAAPFTLTTDPSGNPVIAYREELSNSRPSLSQLYVKHWTGTAWELYGVGSLNINSSFSVYDASLALDASGYPVVAWRELDETTFEPSTIYVKRWTGTAWELIGNDKLNTYTVASSPSLQLNSSGQPIVAYIESDGAGLSTVYVREWNGTSWQTLGNGNYPISESSKNAGDVSLALDPLGRPVIRYRTTTTGNSATLEFKRFDGNNWQKIVSEITDNYIYSQTLVLDKDGNPFIAMTKPKDNLLSAIQAYVLQANH